MVEGKFTIFLKKGKVDEIYEGETLKVHNLNFTQRFRNDAMIF